MPTGLPETVQLALRHVDNAGFFPAEVLSPLREAVTGRSPEVRLPDHPVEILGPWEGLPPPAQKALRRAVEDEITRAMDYHPRGRVWPSMIGGLYTVDRILKGLNFPSRGLRYGEKWAAHAWAGPSNLRERLYDHRRRWVWENGRMVSVRDLLAGLGRRPRWLLGDYMTGVGVDPRCRGFHHDRSRNVTFGYLIGIDLIPSPDGVWCVEANLSTAFNQDRRDALDPEPSVEALFQVASEIGARHVGWHDQQWSEVQLWLIQELEEAARKSGMTVDIREGYRIPRRSDLPPGIRPPRKFVTSPPKVPENTLVLRRNSYSVGTDFVVSNKEPFIRGVEQELRSSGDARVRVPMMSGNPEDVLHPSEDGLPNLVYKYPGFGKGEGVFFLRVDDSAQALAVTRELDLSSGEPPGLFQPFVCSRLLPGRRVYDVRCELFITPLGARHVFSIRREAMRPLPETLDEGLVKTQGVFTSNLATGGRFAPLDPGEEDEIREAALAIGEALVRVLNHTFETVQ